uniref:Uncharacterized protein n=1 Tax=Glycine max TaxID=3847 RepID=K7LF48_SOYBN
MDKIPAIKFCCLGCIKAKNFGGSIGFIFFLESFCYGEEYVSNAKKFLRRGKLFINSSSVSKSMCGVNQNLFLCCVHYVLWPAPL